ncbi:U4/U6.U5 small nuclear ribonucleoprotein 27 kDa protein [Onthophagus taurus]|uniref:U4/U6.U5 small nuclear ribonucleoprotein 27 kDa protein n=1 Tax=Onthophagus taurus TaxID=166361 RepID=UPI000C20BEEB|nr:U4/U6.U5 small nuclear ribonucleoprotein 27 kDa protein [Onthophagus taurus]
MGRRSRSKSPRRRDRDRERERDRDRDNNRHRRKRSSRERVDRSRERDSRRRHSNDRDVYRRYSRSRSRSTEKKSSSKGGLPERPVVTAADLEGKSPDEQEMMKMMGFCSFDSTKGKKVEGNDVGDVHVILKRKYRQYMNRKGGFNRPLDFVA